MNYQKHYDILITRGQRTLIHGYRERHHIIPRCMGGTNEEDNLVYLTAEEHYVAHQLLVKIYPGNKKLIYAANLMCTNSNGNRSNNKKFSWLRLRMSEAKLKGTPWNKGLKTGPRTQEVKDAISKFNIANNKHPPSQKGKAKTKTHKENIRKSKEDKSNELNRIFKFQSTRAINSGKASAIKEIT